MNPMIATTKGKYPKPTKIGDGDELPPESESEPESEAALVY